MPPRKRPSQPIVRVAPLRDVHAYIVTEDELDRLAQGSSAGLLLNFGLALLPTAGGIVVTMASSQLSDLNFLVFTCVAVILSLGGVICLTSWWFQRGRTSDLLAGIKDRMPPPDDAEQLVPPNP